MLKNFLAALLVIVPLVVLIASIITTPPIVYAAQSRVGLGTADDFAVLAGAGITNTGATTISGDVGTFPTTTETGFAGLVTFSSGTNNVGNAVTQGAKTDLVTAYNDAAGRLPATTIAADLGGQTLTAGVYNSGSSIGLTGTVTLDAAGDANAVFIFQAGSTLITASGSKVSLINGAQACNVYWQVGSSATLGTTTNFIGNILALESITLNTSATVNGRVLARDGAVTMDTNTITRADCAAGTTGARATTTSTSSTSSSGGSSGVFFPYCPPLASTIVAPFIIESKRVSPTSISFSWGPQSGTDLFNVEYGFEHGKWLYNTNVTGFETTINDLPPNQPIWVQIAGRSDCMIGSYGVSKLIGGDQQEQERRGRGPAAGVRGGAGGAGGASVAKYRDWS